MVQRTKWSLPLGVGTANYAYYEGEFDNLPDFTKLKPVATGIGPAFDLVPAKHGNDYALKFDGVFKTDKDGQHKFTLTSDDGSRLLIDGKVVVNNDGVHAPKTVTGSTFLKNGGHKGEAQFFQGGGGAELAIDIEGSGLARQPLGALGAPKEAELIKKPEPT